MKHLRLVLPLALVAFLATWSLAPADTFDSDSATVQKKTDKTATVTVGKDSFVVPIMFDDGADWSSVKDHYEMNPAGVAGLKKGTMCISVGTDGTLTYKSCGKK